MADRIIRRLNVVTNDFLAAAQMLVALLFDALSHFLPPRVYDRAS